MVVGSPQCAHCLAMALLPAQLSDKYNVDFKSFAKLSDVSAALASGQVDVAQIDYTGLVSFISRGLPIVAISGQVNGGSDMLVSPKIDIQVDDWNGFKKLVDDRKNSNQKLKIATEFGTVQDIETRLQLPQQGIDPNNDVTMINVPSTGQAQALQSGSVDVAVPVQPFSAAAVAGGYGKHFTFPYNQPSGNLTNVVVVSQKFMSEHPSEVQDIAAGMNKLVPYLKTSQGQEEWAAAVAKYTNSDASSVKNSLSQLSPDIQIPFSQVRAIADAMFARKLIPEALSDATLREHINYDPLAKATSSTPQSLGDTP